jgi:hypothetical protein
MPVELVIVTALKISPRYFGIFGNWESTPQFARMGLFRSTSEYETSLLQNRAHSTDQSSLLTSVKLVVTSSACEVDL